MILELKVTYASKAMEYFQLVDYEFFNLESEVSFNSWFALLIKNKCFPSYLEAEIKRTKNKKQYNREYRNRKGRKYKYKWWRTFNICKGIN